MKINQRLNLVLPIERDSGPLYVHATPIGREVFEKFYLIIAKTFNQIYAGNLGPVAGPRVASLLLRDIATTQGVWEGPDGVKMGLLAEIRRLCNVFAPDPTNPGNGWGMLPLDVAIPREVLTEDEADEVMNSITFFTVASRMHKAKDLASITAVSKDLWGWEISLLNCTEFGVSLPTLIRTGNTGATQNTSSVPS